MINYRRYLTPWILFINGAKNKGGLLKVVSYVIPQYQGHKSFFVLGVFVFLAVGSGFFLSQWIARRRKIVSYLVMAIPLSLLYLLLFDAPEAAWEKGYYYSFYLLIGLLCFHFGNGFKKISFQETVLFSGALSILLANTMAGPSFARLIVSNILAVPVLLSICANEFSNLNLKAQHRRTAAVFATILVSLFALQGLKFKELNGIFFRLLPQLSEQTAQLETSRLRGMKLDPQQAEIIEKTVSDIRKHTSPSDPIYVFFGMPFLYYVSERPNQYFYDFLWWDITSRDDVSRLFESLKRQPPKLVVATRTLDILGTSNNKYVDSELTPFLVDFVSKDYQLIATHGAVELWLRK